MLTSEVLNKAADLIEVRGWTTGPATEEVGSPWGGGAASSAPVCLEGGILAAMGLRTEGPADIPPNDFHRCPAYRAVHSYLEMNEGALVFMWNDKPGRTASEVIEVLRAAAAIEQARESQAVAVSA